jgi:hypothetical protein
LRESTGAHSGPHPHIAAPAPVLVHRRHIALCRMFQAADSNRHVQPIGKQTNGARLRGHTPQTDRSAQSSAPVRQAGRCRASYLCRARAAVHSRDTIVGFGRPPFGPRLLNSPLIRSTRTQTNGQVYRISSGALTPSSARPEAKIVTTPSTSASRAAVVSRSF